MSELSSLGQGMPLASLITTYMFNLAHAQIVHVLIEVYIAYPHCSAEYTKLQLGCIDCYTVYLHACEQLMLHAVKYGLCIQSACTSLLQSPPRHQHFSAFITSQCMYLHVFNIIVKKTDFYYKKLSLST